MKLVKNGISQGSPIFSILVFFYSVGLLDIFKTLTNSIKIPENHTYNYSTYIFILIYIDDGKLTVSSHLLDTNNYVFAKAYYVMGCFEHEQFLFSFSFIF